MTQPPAPSRRPVAPADVAARVKAHHDELVALRRDLHAHPELSWAEVRTTRLLRERLLAAGLAPRVLPAAPAWSATSGRATGSSALRADIDALPLVDRKDVPYASTVPGVCHACGHDLHTAAVLGAGLVLAELAAEGPLPGPGPADLPAGRGVRRAAAPWRWSRPVDADGVERIFALHCDPRDDVGKVGLRVGADHRLRRPAASSG